jgi:TPR repeat protein
MIMHHLSVWPLALAIALSSCAESGAPAEPRPARNELMGSAWRADKLGDCGRALALLRKAADHQPADAVSINATNILGDMYVAGRCVEKDDARALDLFARSAAAGDALASFNVGVLEDWRQEYAKAVAAYRAAAEEGYPHAEAILGGRYRIGRGVARDDAESVKWYRRAAEHHDRFGEYGLANAYEQGLGGLSLDGAQAEHWYRLSAEHGFAPAQAHLGWMYSQGRGVAVDHAAAMRWYRRAADKGIPSAMNGYAVCLDEGYGVARDPRAAIVWYRRAAEYGQPNAMHSLASHYARGTDDVAKDPNEAFYWALLADRFYTHDSHQNAVKEMIAALEQSIDSDAQQRIRQRVAAFSPRRAPRGDVPTVQQTTIDLSIRERLRNEWHFSLYAVTFEGSRDVNGGIVSLRVVRVTDAAAGDGKPVDIEVPSFYGDAVRAKLSEKQPPTPEGAEPSSFSTSFFFTPAYPWTVITDLDAGIDDQP